MTAQISRISSTLPNEPRQLRWNGELLAQAFRNASMHKAWTLGFESMDADLLEASKLRLEGRLPARLRDTLYRNGPARHERGGRRNGHLHDGDGMVQAFVIGADRISHCARYVQTAKYRNEHAAGRF